MFAFFQIMCIRKLHKNTIPITINITASSSTTTMINKTDVRKGKHFWRTSNGWLDVEALLIHSNLHSIKLHSAVLQTLNYSVRQIIHALVHPSSAQHSPKHVSSYMHHSQRIPPPIPLARPVFLMMIIKLSLTDASSFCFNHKIQLTVQCMKWNVVVIPPAGCRLALLACMHTPPHHQ